MAMIRNLDYPIRINGDLSVPSNKITVGSITLDNTNGKVTATSFAGDGSLLTNLSSANMAGVLLLNGTRNMAGILGMSDNQIRLRVGTDTGHYIGWRMYQDDGTTMLDGVRIAGYTGIELYKTNGSAQLAIFYSTGSKINSPLTVTGDVTFNGTGNQTFAGNIVVSKGTVGTVSQTGSLTLGDATLTKTYGSAWTMAGGLTTSGQIKGPVNILDDITGNMIIGGNITASGKTISAGTINAMSNLQENGTNLSAKYLALAGGQVTGKFYANAFAQYIPGTSMHHYNVTGHRTDGNTTGAFIIHTPIGRTSTEMFRIRVYGYMYGLNTVLDFTIVGYAYSGSTGSVDGLTGAVVNYSMVDRGNDSLNKYVGIDANGNVAIALGDIATGSYFPRFSVDFWSSKGLDYATSGWSVDLNTTANFGWKDIKGPLSNSMLGGTIISGITVNGGITTSGTNNITAGGNISASGTITATGNMSINGGTLTLGNGTSNRVIFSQYGISAPNGTNNAAGQKITLWNDTNTWGIGIESGAVWYASNNLHKWYTGATPTNVMTLDGAGNLSITGTISAADVSFIGNSSNGYLRIATGAGGVYLQATNGAKNGSNTLWLTGLSGATTTVKTVNTTIDDSAGNMTVGGSIIVSSNTTINGGTLTLGNTTSNILKFANYGTAAPTATGGTGMKIDLYNGEYGIGIGSASTWYTSDTYHRFYTQNGGTDTPVEVMTLDGSGNLTVTGSLTSKSALKIVGSSTGNANYSYIQFMDSDGTTRRGFVGDGSSAEQDIYLAADTGNVVLFTTTGGVGLKLTQANTLVSKATTLDDGSGNATFRTVTSNVANGTAPFTVTSSTVVNNLNAHYLNGVDLTNVKRTMSHADTRSVFDIPYQNAYQRGSLFLDFKGTSVTGLASSWSGVMTVAHYNDASGGYPHQLAFNQDGEIYHRIGASVSKATWTASTAITLNANIQPTVNNGHYYIATVAGTTGATQPTWPTGNGATVVDGGVTWKETGVYWTAWNNIVETDSTGKIVTSSVFKTYNGNVLDDGSGNLTTTGSITSGGVINIANAGTNAANTGTARIGKFDRSNGSFVVQLGNNGGSAQVFDIINAAWTRRLLGVNNTGSVYTDSVTLDDGSGNASFKGVSVGGGSWEKYVGDFNSTTNVANEKIDLYFTGGYVGYLDVILTGNWGYNNIVGQLVKRFSLHLSGTSTMDHQQTRIVEAMGAIDDQIAISDLTYDATNSRWRIQISKIATYTGSTARVYVKGVSISGASPKDIALGTIYTTDVTVPARQYVYYQDRLGVNTTPAYALDVSGDIQLTGAIQNTSVVRFLNGGTAQGIKVGSQVVSDLYSDTAPTNGIYSKGNIDTPARMGAMSYKVSSTFTDLVNNSTWYGLGYSNVVIGTGYYTQLAGYWGLMFKTSANEIRIPGSGDMTFNGNIIYHAGNYTAVMPNATDQSVGSNFSVKGTMFLGSTGSYPTTGDLIMYNVTGNKVIHLDGNDDANAGKIDVTSIKSYINGKGEASFASTVTINKLVVSDRGRVDNLNTELFNGRTELEFSKNVSSVDVGGYGVQTGFDYTIFDGNTLTFAPATGQTKSVVYTYSGRRKDFDSFNFPIPTNGATSGDIYYVVYVKGPSQLATEGDVAFIGGTLNGGEPTIDTDAVKLFIVKRRAGNAAIAGSDVIDARRWKNVIMDVPGNTLMTQGSFKAGGTIYEGGQPLYGIYSRLGTSGVPINNTFFGRQAIQSTGVGAGNYYLRITDGTKMISYTADEIISNGQLWIGSTGAANAINLNSSVTVNTAGYLKVSKNATSIAFAIGDTTKTWTHNYGNAQYAIVISSNSSMRHIKWGNKTANTLDIIIDDGAGEACNVDVVIMPY